MALSKRQRFDASPEIERITECRLRTCAAPSRIAVNLEIHDKLELRMQPVSNDNFGPLIAYLVPGATAFWGLSRFSPTLQVWLAASPENVPTISGFLYLTLASLTVGMTVTALRWAIVDHLHAWTGLPPPRLDFSRLAGRVDAYHLLIDIHYRHYQFYANMLIATAIAYACHRVSVPGVSVMDAGFLILETVFFATSRDTLRKYYVRIEQLLTD